MPFRADSLAQTTLDRAFLDAMRPTFARMTRVARDLFDCYGSDVVVVHGQNAWRAHDGGESYATNDPATALVVEREDLVWIEETRDHPELVDHPWVTGEPHLRAYAGAPIRLHDGRCVGALCAVDQKPRALDPRLGRRLMDLAQTVAHECDRVLSLRTQRRAEEELIRTRDAAEAANRAKSEFLANMSHELRTPLNGVMGLTSVLARTPLSAQQKELVHTIESSASVLEGLLSDILDLTRIETGKLKLDCAPFDLGAMVKDHVAVLKPVADRKGLAFNLSVAPEASGIFAGDVLRLGQVLTNLINNAIKFTPVGSVDIRVSAEPDAGRSARLSFAVADTGVGFDAETHARIFERFVQADTSATRRHGGAGLGLAISSSLAQAMGGEIVAVSTPGQGSTFTLTVELPYAAPSAEALPQARATQPAASRAPRILAADDHLTNRKVVELILGAVGMDLVSVENGAQAVEQAAAGRFDLILMDIQMPVMDGWTAIREIRRIEAREGRARTPIYTLTANALPEHAEASYAAGADGHLTKPIAANGLLAAVEQACLGWTEDEEAVRTAHA